MATPVTITKLSVNITTYDPGSGDSKNQVDLLIGYESTYGGVPINFTARLHDGGTFIGDQLDVTLEGDELPDDIARIHTLELMPKSNYNPQWKLDEVVVEAEDSTGTKTKLLDGLPLKGATGAQVLYAQDAPEEGVYGLIYDTSKGVQIFDLPVVAGQMLTISIDPKQEWMLDGQVPCNCNGPLIDYDEPYMVHKENRGYNKTRAFTFIRGAFVAAIMFKHPHEYVGTWGGSNHHTNGYYDQYLCVGNYVKVPVLCDGQLLLKVWDDNFDPNVGKIGVKVELHKVNYPTESKVPVPGSATQFRLRPQENFFGSKNLVDTGIDLDLDDVIHVRCNPYDNWTLNKGAGLTTNANGFFAPTSGQNKPSATAIGGWWFSSGCLLGTLDEGQTYFAVGTWLDMTARKKGRLKLVVFENSVADNSGEVEAHVWTTKGPYTPGAALGSAPAEDLDITINPDGNMLKESIVLTNNTQGIVSLDDVMLYVPTAMMKHGVKKYYVFPDGVTMQPGEALTVHTGAKAGGTYNFGAPAQMLYGVHPKTKVHDLVILARFMKEQEVA